MRRVITRVFLLFYIDQTSYTTSIMRCMPHRNVLGKYTKIREGGRDWTTPEKYLEKHRILYHGFTVQCL